MESIVQVRQATPKDGSLVAQVLRDFVIEVKRLMDSELPPPNFQKSAGLFKQLDPNNSVVYLATGGDEAAGILTAHKIPRIRYGDFCLEVEELFVYPKYQGQGVATLLMDAAHNWAKENDVRLIKLLSGNELERAHSFYRKYGFTQPEVGFRLDAK